MVFLLDGCGAKKNDSKYGSGSYKTESRTESTTSKSTKSTQAESMQVSSTTPKTDIEWITKTIPFTDSNGYTFEATLKLSPWILLSNTEIIESAWSKVGQDYKLPGFNDWGLFCYDSYYSSNGYGSYFNVKMTDMFYCVGEVSFKNTTYGWDITSGKTKTLETALKINTRDLSDEEKKELKSDNTYHIIGKSFFSNDVSIHVGRASLRAYMKSNNWGPTPFIIMAPENISPNYPEGQFHNIIKQFKIVLVTGNSANNDLDDYGTDEKFKVGIIGKDKVYVPPVA